MELLYKYNLKYTYLYYYLKISINFKLNLLIQLLITLRWIITLCFGQRMEWIFMKSRTGHNSLV